MQSSSEFLVANIFTLSANTLTASTSWKVFNKKQKQKRTQISPLWDTRMNITFTRTKTVIEDKKLRHTK